MDKKITDSSPKVISTTSSICMQCQWTNDTNDKIFQSAVENHRLSQFQSPKLQMSRDEILSRINLWHLWEDRLTQALFIRNKNMQNIQK